MNGRMNGMVEWLNCTDSCIGGQMDKWIDVQMKGWTGRPAERNTHPSLTKRLQSDTSGLISATRAFNAAALRPICLPPLMPENRLGGEVISCVFLIEMGFVSQSSLAVFGCNFPRLSHVD